MSPLYTVFKFKQGSISLDFYEYFFKSTAWYRHMNNVANYGARHDRMNISGSDFFNLPLPFPTLPEQTKIADFLTAIDQKIDFINIQLEQTQLWKKGLLQQMFV